MAPSEKKTVGTGRTPSLINRSMSKYPPQLYVPAISLHKKIVKKQK